MEARKDKIKPNSINGDLALKTLKVLDNVDGEKDLNKLKLTPLEYHTARLLLREYWDKGETATFWKAAANFFKKQGFIVEPTEDGVGWLIRGEL